MLMKALQAIEEEAEEIAQTPSEEKNEPRPLVSSISVPLMYNLNSELR